MEKDNNYVVYRHISPEGKSYIGLTKNDYLKRWGYNGSGYHGQYFGRIIKKFGWENIKHEILFENLSIDEAREKEIESINKYNSFIDGYNRTKGGECEISQPVIFINTQTIFEDIYVASKYFSIPYTTIKGYCNSNSISSRYDENGRYYCFAYYDSNKEYSIKQYIIEKNRDSTIICLETNELFINTQEVERVMGLFATNVRKNCLRQYENCGGYHFMYYREYLEKGKLYKDKYKEGIKVICLTTNKLFESIYKASSYYNIPLENIRRCCLNEGYSYAGVINKQKMIWQFYEDYLINPKNINNIKHHNGGKKVLCIDTGEVFDSIIQASKIKKVDKTGISNCCLQKQKTCGGYIWKYLQEVE